MEGSILIEAAREGKVDVLGRLLHENPSILADIRLTAPEESVLHVATKSGQLNFVHELMKIDPDIAQELNKDGFRPLEIVVITGNLAIAKTILSFNPTLGRLRGKDNRNALHYAAVKGRVEIIQELLSTYADCLEDITVHGQTCLHLAVQHYQFHAFCELVKWVKRLGKESLVNFQDGDGNTVLHLAVSTKQYACVNLLLDENRFLRGIVEPNVRNGMGLTALDILDLVIQDYYISKIREKLQQSGATKAPHSTTITAQNQLQLGTNPQRPIQHRQSEPATMNWFKYFKFQEDRDSPSDTRNAMLVVAALIATVTFQAGVSPSSLFFDASQNRGVLGFFINTYLFWNSLGFSASGIIILYLTSGFPLHRELYISILSMLLTYFVATSAIISVIKAQGKVQYLLAYVLQAFGLLLPYFLRWPPVWRTYWGEVIFKSRAKS